MKEKIIIVLIILVIGVVGVTGYIKNNKEEKNKPEETRLSDEEFQEKLKEYMSHEDERMEEKKKKEKEEEETKKKYEEMEKKAKEAYNKKYAKSLKQYAITEDGKKYKEKHTYTIKIIGTNQEGTYKYTTDQFVTPYTILQKLKMEPILLGVMFYGTRQMKPEFQNANWKLLSNEEGVTIVSRVLPYSVTELKYLGENYDLSEFDGIM